LSAALQLAAAVVALRLIRLTGRTTAWVLIATAVSLMALRRIITLTHVIGGATFRPDFPAELVALLISTLMVVGLAVIGPMFRSIRTSEEAARESELRFRDLFQESPVAILEADMSALKTRLVDLARRGDVREQLVANPTLAVDFFGLVRFLAANRAAVELFSARDEADLIANVRRSVTPDTATAFQESLVEIANGASEIDKESELLDFDGVRRDVLLHWSAPPQYREDLSRVLLTLADVTERREMQARLMVSDRMASIGTLAAGVAHEINNPLTYIYGNLQLIERALRHGDAQLRGYVEAAIEGSQRVRDIVSDLQILSRSEASEERPFEIDSALELATRMAHNEVRHRARLVVEKHEPLWTSGSGSRLTQVLLNLLVNAAQSIPVGDVDNNEILVRIQGDAEEVHIHIRDTGGGIPREVLPRIFDPFFTTKGPMQGTGLGLYICHRIVTDMGGDLEVISTSKEGTEFRISLPRAEPDEESSKASEEARRENGSRHRVLVIDDEPAIRDLVLLMLEGHDVVTASSGRKGIETLEGEQFDVILCDLNMADMTGMDVFDYLKTEHPTDVDRVVFMTGGVFTDRARSFLDAVPNPRLDKPFTESELAEVVDRVAGHDRTAVSGASA